MKYNNDEYIGKKFGKLTVIEIVHVDKNGKQHSGWQWKCKCDCGNETLARPSLVLRGKKLSCGCLKKEQEYHNLGEKRKTHGKSNTRLYRIWRGMIDRCENEKTPSYKDYGSRGIKVCDEWAKSFSSFYEWAINSGYDESLTIERIDVNKGYSPDNCKWITLEEQAINKQNTIWVEYHGEKVQLSVICKKLKVDYGFIYYRIFNMGMSADEALDTPSGETMTLLKKCEINGIDYSVVKSRLRLGWDEEKALLTPVRSNKRNSHK